MAVGSVVDAVVGDGVAEAMGVAARVEVETAVGEGIAEAVGVGNGGEVEANVGEGVPVGLSQNNGGDPGQAPAVLVPFPPTNPF